MPITARTSRTEPRRIRASFSTASSTGLNVYQNSGSFLPPPFMGHAISNGTGFPIIVTFSTSLDSASLDFGINNLPGVSNLNYSKGFQRWHERYVAGNIHSAGNSRSLPISTRKREHLCGRFRHACTFRSAAWSSHGQPDSLNRRRTRLI